MFYYLQKKGNIKTRIAVPINRAISQKQNKYG